MYSKMKKRIVDSNMILSEDYKERAIRLLSIAKDFVASKDPNDVLEYTASMNPKDAYVLGLIIGRMLMDIGESK